MTLRANEGVVDTTRSTLIKPRLLLRSGVGTARQVDYPAASTLGNVWGDGGRVGCI